ncbi:hypothetical protein QFI91_15845 [Raoultella sp. WB_B2P2-3]|jgi:hypothetical protein|uniref:Uncharacterized protein n=1 Tax=Raoultella scottii TaxID=3040937 RepID=A0ABU8ZA39_9ENTR
MSLNCILAISSNLWPVKRDARGMVSTLRFFEKQGRIQKNETGRKVTWSLPVVLPITEPEEPTDHPELPVGETPAQQKTIDLAKSEKVGVEVPLIALPQPVAESEPELQPAESVQ